MHLILIFEVKESTKLINPSLNKIKKAKIICFIAQFELIFQKKNILKFQKAQILKYFISPFTIFYFDLFCFCKILQKQTIKTKLYFKILFG
jgi:hypothetical protein